MGTDIVFTYGPLGFLTIPCFSGSFVVLRIVVDVALALAVAAPLCVLSWRLGIAWRFLVLGSFLVVTANIQAEAQDLLIYVGLFCWGLLCLQESRRVWAYVACLILFAAFSALTKLTCLIAAGLTIGAVALDHFLREVAAGSADLRSAVSPICNQQTAPGVPHTRGVQETASLRYGRLRIWAVRSLTILAVFVLFFMAGWLSAGQSLIVLPAFLSRGFLMAGTYDQTMGVEPPLAALILGLLAVITALAAVIMRCLKVFEPSNPLRRWRQCVLLIWLTSLLFLTWKHGFVRADSIHVFFFAGFVPMLPLLIQTLHCQNRFAKRLGVLFGIGCCVLSVLSLEIVLRPDHLRLAQPLRRAIQNTISLSQPMAYCEVMNQRLQSERARMALPEFSKIASSGTVDFLGNLPSYAVLNSLNYRPRPVFQSYAAYNAALMKLNREFYLSEARPNYVICFLAPIDSRFPPLEDAPTLRNLLINYDLAAGEDAFLLLKARRRPSVAGLSSPSPPLQEREGERRPFHTQVHAEGQGELALPAPEHLKLVTEGTVRFGELINLTNFSDLNTWLEITIDPTLVGRLRQFLYQPPVVRLAVWDEAGRPLAAKFRAPAPMLAAGFLASPLVLNNATLVDLYCANPVIRPSAYAIEINGADQAVWKASIRFRLYKIENVFGTRLPGFIHITHEPPVVPRGGERVQVAIP